MKATEDALFRLARDRPVYRKGFQSGINTKRVVKGYKMSGRYFKVLMFFGILLASTLAYPASYGQSEVVLSLDKRVYTVGESVVVLGLVQSPGNIPAIVQVWNPNNEACSFQQVDVNDDGSFIATPILLSGRICGTAGAYTVNVFYGEFEGTATFEVQVAVAGTKAGNGRLQTLLDILDKARQNVDNKITDVKGKGIAIPDAINDVYEEGLAEFESAKKAVNADDVDSANKHVKNAMKAFRQVFAKLIQLEGEEEETEAPAVASKAEREDLEKAEESSRLKQAIARAIEFKNKLTKIAATSDISALETSIVDFDQAIAEAREFLENGDIDAAAKSLAKARQILADMQKSLMQNAQERKLNKAKEFVAKTVERIDRMIADAKEIGLPEEVIDALEEAKQKLLNAKTVNEIFDISKEFKGKQKELSEHKGKNFEKTLEHLKSKLEETKAKAEQTGLDLTPFDRIQDLIEDAISEWESGETEAAIHTLEKSAEILREINGMLDHMGSRLQELDGFKEAVNEMKQAYQDNPEALKAIEKALRLINGAKETLQSAMSKADVRIAEDMIRQAKHILERIKNSETENEFKTDAGEVGEAGKIEKFVADLERRTHKLQKTAEEHDNSKALTVIQQASELITKAKQMISEENYERAKGLLREANELLNKAERMLREESGVNAPSPKDIPADAIMKEIQMLEKFATDLLAKAEDNDDALDEIEVALLDIEDAKEFVSEGKLSEAKQKLNDARMHLKKAKQIIEQNEGQDKEEREKERENEGEDEDEDEDEREDERERKGTRE